MCNIAIDTPRRLQIMAVAAALIAEMANDYLGRAHRGRQAI